MPAYAGNLSKNSIGIRLSIHHKSLTIARECPGTMTRSPQAPSSSDILRLKAKNLWKPFFFHWHSATARGQRERGTENFCMVIMVKGNEEFDGAKMQMDPTGLASFV